MQRIIMNRSLLTELGRCDRSFVMSLFHKELDNAHIADKVGEYDTSISEEQRTMAENMEAVYRIASETGGIQVIDCINDYDVFEKVDKTMSALSSGAPCVIADGALEANWLIVPFSLLVVREDGMWEVYHLSTKTMMKKNSNYAKTVSEAMADVGPLMKVLADGYADRIAMLYVVGIDGRYSTPYPDPETGLVYHDDNNALFVLDFDINSGSIQDYVMDLDPAADIFRIQQELSCNPFWIPDAQMGPNCNAPYPCPFKTYCQSHADPDDVMFHMPYHDRKKLYEYGFRTMRELLEYSYTDPTFELAYNGENDKPLVLSETALRELRDYEYTLQNKGVLY